jgi:Glycosyl hydrolases family 2, TIM barrel domain/Glycosyl hydrolases family 2
LSGDGYILLLEEFETMPTNCCLRTSLLVLLLLVGCSGSLKTPRESGLKENVALIKIDNPELQRRNLDSGWELYAVSDDPAQSELAALKSAKWHKVKLPFSLTDLPDMDRLKAQKVHYAWARIRFNAPPEISYRDALLHLHGMVWGAKIWVNGQLIGQQLGAYRVGEYGISKAIKWGASNEVLVRISGWPVIPRSAKKAHNQNRQVPLIPHGPALFWWSTRHPVFRGQAWVDFFDDARLERVRIVAGTDGRVNIHGISKNYSRNYGVREVRAVIRKDGKIVAGGRVEIPSHYTSFSPRTPYAFKLDSRINKPELWSPESPELYRAELQLIQDGRVLDRWSGNFGFRSFLIREGHFYLNGQRTFLRGVCLWGEGARWAPGLRDNPQAVKSYFIDLPRAANVRAIRHHTIPLEGMWLDMADRNGMLLLQEFPMTTNYIRPNFTPEELAIYRRNIIDEFRTMLPLYWNHPSVVLWVPTNESPSGNAEWENGPLQALFKQADPTRPVMRSGVESDDIYDTHCYNGWWTGSEGQFAIFAEAAACKGRELGKPIGNTEYVENFSGGRVTKWMGPKPENISKQLWQQRRRDVYAQTILEQSEVLRRLSYDINLPYAWAGGYLKRLPDQKGKKIWEPQPNFYALRSALAPVLASIDLADRHVSVASQQRFDLVICDDSGQGQALEVEVLLVSGEPGFQWPSARKGVKVLNSQKVKVPAGRRGRYALRRVSLELSMPRQPGRYYLLAVTPQGSRPSAVSRRILRVLEKAPTGNLAGRKIAVIAGKKQLQADLLNLAPQIKIVSTLAEAEVLLVGSFIHSQLRTQQKLLGGVAAFARTGGRVIVLEQDRSIPQLKLEIPRVRAMGGSSTVFRTSNRDFRAWRGLGADDRVFRRMNGPTGALVRRPLKTAPEDELLLSAAEDSGELKWPVVVRRKLGKGEIIFCQIPLQLHLSGKNADTLAQIILVNLLAR